jgi:hypothetical protein
MSTYFRTIPGCPKQITTFVGDICLIVAPSIAGVLMPVGLLLWPAWWILISLALFRLGRPPEKH